MTLFYIYILFYIQKKIHEYLVLISVVQMKHHMKKFNLKFKTCMISKNVSILFLEFYLLIPFFNVFYYIFV